MALMQGKSKESEASDVPRKQAFAIAHGVKKRMGKKKMAHGGVVEGEPEDMGRGYDRPHTGPQESQDNLKLNPQRRPGAGPKDDVQAQQRFEHSKLAHGQLPQPEQPRFGYSPRSVDPNIRPEPDQGQVKFAESVENDHFAMGGEVKSAMSRRERALLAARGEHPELERGRTGYAEKYPGVGHSANQGPNRDPGPSGHSTRMPLNPRGVAAGPPSSDRISEEEQAMFAKGGPVAMADYHRQRAEHYEGMAGGGPLNKAPSLDSPAAPEESDSTSGGPDALRQGFKDFISGGVKKAKGMAHGGYAQPNLDEYEQGAFYDRGGIIPDRGGGNRISSPRAPQKPMPQGYGKAPLRMAVEEGERFALGGQASGSGIAKRIREQKMAFGGRAHEDDDRPEGGESIDNFRRADHPDNDFLAPEEQTDYHHLNAGDLDEEAEQPKRKGMLDRIMRGIHARNGNR